MLTRRTKLQLVAFVIISVVSVVYSLFRFTDVGKAFGDSGYTAMLDLKESGGIFSNAEVNYRGKQIGRVGEIKLTQTGLQVELNVEPDMPPVPADLDAVVMNRSAIGEQLVDLRPRKEGGPYLEQGTVIPADRTKVPTRADAVITHLHDLAASVPTDSMRTVVDESYLAFQGTGDDLQVLMDATRDFVAGARKNIPDTVDLLRSGNQVLRVQNEEFGSFKSFSRDLRLLSETLKSSDADIRKLIDATPRSARQLSEVVNEIGPGASSLIANLLTLGNIAVTRLEGTEHALMAYPGLAAGAEALLKGQDRNHPQARLSLALNLFDPPPCTKGYEGTERRPGNALEERQHNTKAYCAEPKGSPINVRGSNNVPFGGVPDVATPQQKQSGTTTYEYKPGPFDGLPGLLGGQELSINSMRSLMGLPG